MFNKKLIIQSIRNMPNQMPSDEETVEIILYFKTVIAQVLKKRGLKVGTQLTIGGKKISWSTDDQLSSHKKATGTEHEIEQELFMEFFSLEFIGKSGWIEKNLKMVQGLNDEELWRKFDNRAMNVLRQSLPKSYMEEISEERPERMWLKTELPPDEIEIVFEGAIRSKKIGNEEVEGLMAVEDKIVSALEIMDKSTESRKKKLEKHMDILIDKLMKADIEEVDFKEFYNVIRNKFYNQPQIFIRQLQNKFKDQTLISRYLINTFPSEECFRAIYDREGFLQNLLLKHGNNWEVVLAKIAIKEEAKNKLKPGMNPKEKQLVVQELKDFYRKWLPNINSQHILRYPKSEIKKKPKDLDKILQNFAHLLYERMLQANQNSEND